MKLSKQTLHGYWGMDYRARKSCPALVAELATGYLVDLPNLSIETVLDTPPAC